MKKIVSLIICMCTVTLVRAGAAPQAQIALPSNLVESVQQLNFPQTQKFLEQNKYTQDEYKQAVQEIARILNEKEKPTTWYKNYKVLGRTALYGALTYYLGKKSFEGISFVLANNHRTRWDTPEDQRVSDGTMILKTYQISFCGMGALFSGIYTVQSLKSLTTCNNPEYSTALAITKLLREAVNPNKK